MCICECFSRCDVNINARIYADIFVYAYVNMCLYMYIYIHIYVNMCVYTHMYIDLDHNGYWIMIRGVLKSIL
jgi:hypothetical protein